MRSDPEDLAGVRQRLGITQERMAGLLGVSFVSVNRWEKGHATPLRPVLDLYAAVDAALRAGRKPEAIVRAAAQERPLFLRRLFTMAYTVEGRSGAHKRA